MTANKTKPTTVSVDEFLTTVSNERREESVVLIDIMSKISNEKPVMWGPSIIGFGKSHFEYETGRSGDIPSLAFSPRKASITIYFEGFNNYGEELAKLGKYKNSVSCLYINKLKDIDINILKTMLEKSYALGVGNVKKPQNVDEYIATVPKAAKSIFDQLRNIVKERLPMAEEVLNYGIVGYKMNEKRPRVFISGWKDHVAMYPIPRSESLALKLGPYIKGKGTLWFSLDQPLPEDLIKEIVIELRK